MKFGIAFILVFLKKFIKIQRIRASLVVQQLRFQAPNAEGSGSIPVQRTRSPRLQRRLKVLHVATKT